MVLVGRRAAVGEDDRAAGVEEPLLGRGRQVAQPVERVAEGVGGEGRRRFGGETAERGRQRREPAREGRRAYSLSFPLSARTNWSLETRAG